MKFIISTFKGCFVYDYNRKKIVKQLQHSLSGKKNRVAYGISWFKNKLFVAWRKPHEILEYNKNFELTGRKCSGGRLGDLHQITCFDNKIWVANTGINCISTFDVKNLEFIEKWRPQDWIKDNDKPLKNKYYYKHFNSIMFWKEKMYINAHMTRNNPPSKVWEFEYSNKNFIKKIPGGVSSHNVFFIKNIMYICDSESGRIIRPDTKKIAFSGGPKSFLRGVSLPSGMVVVGRSDFIKERGNRVKGNGGIIVFNNRNFVSPNIIWLRKGPINEVRCLDKKDEAHPTNIFLK